MKKRNQLLTTSVLGGLGILAGAGAAAAVYALFREPLNIALERRTINIPNARGKLPQHGLRILHLSDTHFQGMEWRERTKINQIRKIVSRLEYDLLIHTGDFWHNEQGYENIIALLNMLPAPRLGAYGVLGNHDYVCYSHADMFTRNWESYQSNKNGKSEADLGPHRSGRAQGGSISIADSAGQEDLSAEEIGYRYAQKESAHRESPRVSELAKEAVKFTRYIMSVPFELERVHNNQTERLTQGLAECNMQVLHNRAIHLCDHPDHPDGVDIYLAGVDDVFEGEADLDGALSDIPADATKILLSHNPDILDDPASRQFDLILSGHTHGGQISLPIVGAAHTQSYHLNRHEAAGYIKRDNTQVYISRGVGEGIPIRFGAQPQITLLTVKGD